MDLLLHTHNLLFILLAGNNVCQKGLTNGNTWYDASLQGLESVIIFSAASLALDFIFPKR